MENTRPDAPDTAGAAPEDHLADAENATAGEVETLAMQLGEAEKTIAGLKDSMLRERAEIENQRRRMQRELEQSRKFANESLLRELVSVCDNLEHGLAVETDNAGALREGMQLTLKSLLKVVVDHGLKAINPIGEAFDPELHQAMSMVVSTDQPPNTVVSVMQKGYVLNDRLVRPALVMVAKAPEA
ncbi:MAG TPA: nucleotide exchange factor GrpE [Rhodanobacteraceae bacterium]